MQRSRPSRPRRVILVRLSALGDIIHTWPLATLLHQTNPELEITWVVEEQFLPLVEGHPALASTLTVATRRWRRHPFSGTTRAEIAELKRRLRSLDAELCIDAQGVFKSALVTRWSTAPRRAGLRYPWRRERLIGLTYTERYAGSSSHTHVVATNLELVRSLGLTPPATLLPPDGRWLLEGHAENPAEGAVPGPYVALLPGAGHPSKLLSVATLANVSRELTRDGMTVLVLWGPQELERAQAVVQAAGTGVMLAPQTDLRQLAATLAGAAAVLGGDTGPVHLAASLGVPTLGIFLTTSDARNRPLGHKVAVISATRHAEPRPTGSAKAQQVRTIDPAEILWATRALLAG